MSRSSDLSVPPQPAGGLEDLSPAYFGLVEFDGGGRAMMDFTDVDAEHFDVGTPVSVHFRIKQLDKHRGFRRYFWKAAPA